MYEVTFGALFQVCFWFHLGMSIIRFVIAIHLPILKALNLANSISYQFHTLPFIKTSHLKEFPIYKWKAQNAKYRNFKNKIIYRNMIL